MCYAFDINQAVLSFTLNTAVYVSGKVLAGRTFPSRQAILLEINSPKRSLFLMERAPFFCISIPCADEYRRTSTPR